MWMSDKPLMLFYYKYSPLYGAFWYWNIIHYLSGILISLVSCILSGNHTMWLLLSPCEHLEIYQRWVSGIPALVPSTNIRPHAAACLLFQSCPVRVADFCHITLVYKTCLEKLVASCLPPSRHILFSNIENILFLLKYRLWHKNTAIDISQGLGGYSCGFCVETIGLSCAKNWWAVNWNIQNP